MPQYRYYIMYDNTTEQVIAQGSSKECAAQLHTTVQCFHSLVSKAKHGKRHKSHFLVSGSPDLNSEPESF